MLPAPARRPKLRLLPPGQWKLMPSSLANNLRKRDTGPMSTTVAAFRSAATGGSRPSDPYQSHQPRTLHQQQQQQQRQKPAVREADGEDTTVDFANASLYLSGFQTVFAICCCAFVSILSCWIVPEAGVSAVRTLALCVATGALLMRKPLRVGRAHGVHVVFLSLQPAVPIYLGALVVEQLVHTCTAETSHAPSWRRVVFHAMMLIMLVSGVLRARAPLQETDMPFLLTAGALLVVAILPPPAVAFVGPLCQSVSLWEAGDRLVRSFAFGAVYCAHVYASTASSTLTSSETMIVVTRSASASLWTMGSHVTWLPAAAVQCGIVVMARIHLEQNSNPGGGAYRVVPLDALTTEDDEEDLEQGGGDGPSEEQALLVRTHPQSHAHQRAPKEQMTPGGGTQYSPSSSIGFSDQPIDVVAQQRELLGQPTAVQLACPCAPPPQCCSCSCSCNCNPSAGCGSSGSSGGGGSAFSCVAAPHVHEFHHHGNGAEYEDSPSSANECLPPTCGFGPMAFREVHAINGNEPSEPDRLAPQPQLQPQPQPAQHAQSAQPAPAQVMVATARSAARPPPMSAARMAEIAASIPDDAPPSPPDTGRVQ